MNIFDHVVAFVFAVPENILSATTSYEIVRLASASPKARSSLAADYRVARRIASNQIIS